MKVADKKGAKRAVLIVIVVLLVIGAFVGGFFAGKSGQRVETQFVERYAEVVYAEILSVDDGYFHVRGLDVNDINGRGEYTFSAKENTRLVWHVTDIPLSDFDVGDRIAFYYNGLVLDSNPAQVQNVVKIKLLDDVK
ncbi:MAG: hypothetical protein E7485_03920 [Ruminococcaceae bacterium]|nr:hypothetical protein [Oscillospiraceae bacterium]